MAQKQLRADASSIAAVSLFFFLSFSISGAVFVSQINVGGPLNWTFGFNYTDWAIKTAPFHINDTLVFKYDPPNSTTHAHSVYLIKDLPDFLACNLKKAQLVGNAMQGGGDGLHFALTKSRTYYFACGESKGFHCSTGLMRFFVRPLKRCSALY